MWKDGESQTKIAERLKSHQSVISRYLGYYGYIVTRRMAIGKKHPHYKGGYNNSNGYKLVPIDSTHSYAAMRTVNGAVLEHRLVMAEHLGRTLTRNEIVHHINGDKTDNQIENLQLRLLSHGKGTMHRCLDCGSTNIEATIL